MTTTGKKRLISGAMGLFCFFLQTFASEVPDSTQVSETVIASETIIVAEPPAQPEAHESIFGKSVSLALSHFTWGCEIGASIDLDGYDMSTFDANVLIGYKDKYIRTLGCSVGINRDFQTGTHFIPIMAVFRSPIVPSNKICFADLKAGYSFNSVGSDKERGNGFTFSAGVGFNLASSRRFHSYLAICYQFIHLNARQGVMIDKVITHTDMIALRLGVNF